MIQEILTLFKKVDLNDPKVTFVVLFIKLIQNNTKGKVPKKTATKLMSATGFYHSLLAYALSGL